MCCHSRCLFGRKKIKTANTYSWAESQRVCIRSYLAMFGYSSSGAVFRQDVQPNASKFLPLMVSIQPEQLKFSECGKSTSEYAIAGRDANSEETAETKCHRALTRSASYGSIKCVRAVLAARFTDKLQQNGRMSNHKWKFFAQKLFINIKTNDFKLLLQKMLKYMTPYVQPEIY